MSRLGELIEELCPNGVEYVPLRSISAITIGEFVHKSKQSPDSEYPVYNGGIANTGYYNLFNNFENKIIVSARGANAGFVNRVTTKFWAGNSCYTISIIDEKKVDWNFIYYYLKSSEYNLINMQQRASIPSVSLQQMQSMLVPNPPIEVQREIVRILDNFTELTAELTAELKKRKSQYEFYRKLLYSYDLSVEMKSLGEVTEINRGVRVIKKNLSESQGYPVYQNSMTPLGYHNEFNCNKNTTFMIVAGAAGEVGYSDINFWAADDCFYFHSDDTLVNKFIYYYLLTQDNYIYSRVRKASIPRISRTSIENIKIPIPPLSEQERIVSILDKFDALVNDISIGIPAEIGARKKQYEYYREKLLNFKDVNASEIL